MDQKVYLVTTLTISSIPDTSGIYQFKDALENVLYVGKAVNLRNRLGNYLRRLNLTDKTEHMLSRAKTVSWIETTSEFEALTLEAQLIKIHKPHFNVIWKDDKSYIYIQITDDQFPKIKLCRKQDIVGSTSFGPYPSKRIIAEILRDVRHIIPFCSQSSRVKKPCFYTHLGLCDPCPGFIKTLSSQNYLLQKAVYRRNIKNIKALLSARIETVSKYLADCMKDSSTHADFEQAAIYRDKLAQLRDLTTRHFAPSFYIENPTLAKDVAKSALQGLRDILLPYYQFLTIPKRIECYDISHISGKLATGSMVVCINGVVNKSLYRRFRIRNLSKNDDFACLQQVLERRLNHKEWELPQLIILDGGAPQLRAVARAFSQSNLTISYIGLAKRFEEVVVPYQGSYNKIRLPAGDALHLLQKIRDEAHRFAHSYHTLLRLKALKDTV